MNENLLQYIWQHSLYNGTGLVTTAGEAVLVIHPGRRNTNAGPDFLDARVKIGKELWAGNVELHLRSSDWARHGHQHDLRYSNIILHVVWQHDALGLRQACPLLVLGPSISPRLIDQYTHLVSQPEIIPCAGRLKSIPDIIWDSWLERLVAERWDQKLEEWQRLWQLAANDWRTLLYYRLAANFGFHVNRDAFLELAQSLPLKVLARHKGNLQQVEALLFGQSGLLSGGNADAYAASLEKEYHFLRSKYALQPMSAHRWKFMRLRPANFPTIRIAQFARLVHQSLELFAKMMEIRNYADLFPLLDINAGGYWREHYRFGERAKNKADRRIGSETIVNIIINTVAPMQYLYARLEGRHQLIGNSQELLQSLKPENNNVIRKWKSFGVKVEDAAGTQALLQLYHQYCTARDCLNCAVGYRIIRH